MHPSHDARDLSVLLRISTAIDIVGDVTAIVDKPSEIIAWAKVLPNPKALAWRAEFSSKRYVQVTDHHDHEPIRGHIAAVLRADQHPDFWNALLPRDLRPGTEHTLSREALFKAWGALPLDPREANTDP